MVTYPIRTVAKLTGLTLDTLRAWERRYGAVVPDRDDRGRCYNDAHVERLRLLRSVVEAGNSIGRVAGLPDAELRRLAQRVGGEVLDGDIPDEVDVSQSKHLAAFLAAIDDFSFTRASSEMLRISMLVPPTALIHEVALPLMRLAGSRWHQGTWTIAQEHMVSAILTHLVGSLVRLYQTAPGAPRVLIATPPGERHEFGILASAMMVVTHSCELLYLGVDLPAAEIADAAIRGKADVVLIGVRRLKARLQGMDELKTLADLLAEPVQLWLGGPIHAVKSRIPARALVVPDFKELEKQLSALTAKGV